MPTILMNLVNSGSRELVDHTGVDYSSNLNDFAAPIATGIGVSPSILVSGNFSYVQTTPATAAKALAHQWSFADDFYNRIIINPHLNDVGNVTSATTTTFEVFNAYFVKKNLLTLQQLEADGISLSGTAAPHEFVPLESQIYTVAISLNGPPQISTTFKFLWSLPADTVTYELIGQRVVVFPYLSNDSTKETLEWKTQVLQSNNSTEQRIQLRKHPRQSIEAEYPIDQSQMQRAENLLAGWVTSVWGVPAWHEAQQVANLSSGASVIVVDTTKSDYRVGGTLLIWENAGKSTTAKIGTITSTQLNLSKPITSDFTKPWVTPLRLGRFAGGQAARKSNGFNASVRATFNITDNLALGLGTAPTQYLGEDLYTGDVLKNGEFINDSIIGRVDIVDYGGIVNSFAPWTANKRRRPFRIIAQGMTEVRDFKTFLSRRRGKLKPFWMSTNESNMIVKSVGTITSLITIQDDGYFTYGQSRNHILIKTKSGTTFARAIIAATDIGSGQSIIQLDSAINIDASLILMISFLGLYRLDSDRVELEWGQQYTITATVPLIEVRP